MKRLLKKRRGKFTASSILLSVLFLCVFLSVGCSVIKNNTGKVSTGQKNAESNGQKDSGNIFLEKDKKETSAEDLIQEGSSDKISIVCTTFPQYDWVRNIIGEESDRFNLTLLLDNGVDMHSYQPTVKDIAIVGSSDLFIYIGGESDSWVTDALKEAKNRNIKALNLMDILGSSVKEEEVVEGMQKEKEGFGPFQEEEKEPEYDEHIWLSIRNAEILVKNIGETIIQLDKEEYAGIYKKNTDTYLKKLDRLDKQYKKVIENSKYKTILFGDRFPFRYMADDYHLKYYAAFVGCSAETMAGFETVTFLAKKVDKLQLPVILTIENSDGRIAESIRSNTRKKNQKILTMDSLQSVTNEQLSDGITYLKVMKENLSVLSEALNNKSDV